MHDAPVVDIHTHVYPPSFVQLLKARSHVPYIRTFAPDPTARLIILPGEDDPAMPSTARGRPIGPEYYDVAAKIAFMDAHGIHISVLSQANPWLDFLAADEAPAAARTVNGDINAMCACYPGRLFAFATLPVAAGPAACVDEVRRLRDGALPWVRGVVLGTNALGRGLDDAEMDAVWAALQDAGLTVFVHPHYGLPKDVYGPRAHEYGHVLPLAMGFPLETTIAVARMLLAGVFDRHSKLQLLLAHSGGTLPFLAGRLESCIAHDAHLKKLGRIECRRDVWDVLKTNILLDAVAYSSLTLRAAVEASGGDRVLFGTDHPFFPPLGGGERAGQMWLSVSTNLCAIDESFAGRDQAASTAAARAVLGGNAVRLLNLKE